MSEPRNWAVITPMANEASEFEPFIAVLTSMLDTIGSGRVYFVVDQVSRDKTRQLCDQLAARDARYISLWAPENRNVVDAYTRGFRAAYEAGHDFIIEMDAGLSHDPRALPMFLRLLHEGYECVFGSRFCKGGSMADSSLFRRTLSRGGTVLSNIFLGTAMFDMTSGFEGFRREVVGELIAYPLRSRAHFYQTEVRYLLRGKRFTEVPIHYRAPSKSVRSAAILNSFDVLFYYFGQRLRRRSVALEKAKSVL
ncbi:MAG: glycosyltransferase [Verrucomicrobiota bacterium]|nr:glycosyltransferase [Verrucomicrobiota bacterium]